MCLNSRARTLLVNRNQLIKGCSKTKWYIHTLLFIVCVDLLLSLYYGQHNMKQFGLFEIIMYSFDWIVHEDARDNVKEGFDICGYILIGFSFLLFVCTLPISIFLSIKIIRGSTRTLQNETNIYYYLWNNKKYLKKNRIWTSGYYAPGSHLRWCQRTRSFLYSAMHRLNYDHWFAHSHVWCACSGDFDKRLSDDHCRRRLLLPNFQSDHCRHQSGKLGLVDAPTRRHFAA